MKILSPSQKCNDTKVLLEENSFVLNDEEKSGKGMGKKSMLAYCGRCNEAVQTKVEIQFGSLAHALCCIYFLITWIGCCIPYLCIGKVRSVRHICPKCQSVLGVHRPKKFNQCTKGIVCGVVSTFIIVNICIGVMVFYAWMYQGYLLANLSYEEGIQYGEELQENSYDYSDETPTTPIPDWNSDDISMTLAQKLDYYGNPITTIQDSDSDEYYGMDNEGIFDSDYVPMSSTPDPEEWDTGSGLW